MLVEVWVECLVPWIDITHQSVRLFDNANINGSSWERSASQVLEKRFLDLQWVVRVDSSQTLGSLSGDQKEEPPLKRAVHGAEKLWYVPSNTIVRSTIVGTQIHRM